MGLDGLESDCRKPHCVFQLLNFRYGHPHCVFRQSANFIIIRIAFCRKFLPPLSSALRFVVIWLPDKKIAMLFCTATTNCWKTQCVYQQFYAIIEKRSAYSRSDVPLLKNALRFVAV
jgi:hypothetical protein